MSNSIVSYSYGPFLTRDLHQTYGAKYLEPSDIAHASQVCKQWRLIFSDQNLWKALFEKEGIPLVISTSGAERNYKEDFKILCPITISGKIISQYFGKVVEKIPPITEERFNELKEPDPFEEGKSKGETFVFIVDPSFVMRTINQETPLALDYLGNLTESPKQESEQNLETNTTEKSELKIPLSLKNIKVLSSYPLKGKENMPVFAYFEAEVSKQCNTRPDKISVYFMRRDVVEKSRDKPYDQQKKLVEDQGFEVPPLRVRVLFDTVGILKDGTCPDASKPRMTYSRHPETVRYGNNVYHSVVGGFAPRAGVRVSYSFYSLCGHDGHIGVAPGGPAEVLAIGT